MMRRSWIVCCILAFCCSISAQKEDANRYTSHALMGGVGLANVFDNYLSPLEYTGIEARLQRETFRKTKLMEGNVFVQTLLNVNAYTTHSPAENAHMYGGLVNWNISWLYKWELNNRIKVLAGPMADMNGGVIYNERNSNNPAQAKAYANIGVNARVIYNFNLFHKPATLHYLASLPLLGAMFSPQYGESYYEMFGIKKGGSHNVCLTTPFSQPSLRHAIYLDYPISNTTLRIGYVGDLQQHKVNNLKGHVYSHALMFGFVKNFKLIKQKDKDHVKTPYQL